MTQPPAVTPTASPPTTPPTPPPPLNQYKTGHYGSHNIHCWVPTQPITSVVVYLPSTYCETLDGALIQNSSFNWTLPSGGELVVEPIVTEHSNKPFKVPPPEWIVEWLCSLQADMYAVPFYLIGCSRGAAWGMKLMETSLTFRRAMLIAPYYQGSWIDSTDHVQRRMAQRLQRDPTSIKIIYGSADCWQPPASLLSLVRNMGSADSVIELTGSDHYATVVSMATFWHGVVVMSGAILY